MAVLLEPDEWERDAESLFTKPNIWRKVNPHIGVTVQNDYYEQRIRESRNDSETKKETITKLFNVWQSERVTEWVKPEDIAGLQIEQTIDDLDSDDGWEVYTGFDFSMGDDIYAVSYLATRWNDDSETQEFFADMDAWVAEEEMLKSPLRRLYERWRDEGWLHVVPGAVFPTSLFLDRVAELGENLHMVAYGFDPYKSKQPVNDLSAWVLSEGANPKECVIPVRQNFANYNSLVLEMDTLMRTKPALISFSKNPLWQWEFGNARIAVSTDGMENRKVVKSSDAAKVDNVQALMNALYCFDMIQGRVS
jgi:phage terminase large subunit-like protein